MEKRNYAGIQLIDRNDELCILYEKSNVHEATLVGGHVRAAHTARWSTHQCLPLPLLRQLLVELHASCVPLYAGRLVRKGLLVKGSTLCCTFVLEAPSPHTEWARERQIGPEDGLMRGLLSRKLKCSPPPRHTHLRPIPRKQARNSQSQATDQGPLPTCKISTSLCKILMRSFISARA